MWCFSSAFDELFSSNCHQNHFVRLRVLENWAIGMQYVYILSRPSSSRESEAMSSIHSWWALYIPYTSLPSWLFDIQTTEYFRRYDLCVRRQTWRRTCRRMLSVVDQRPHGFDERPDAMHHRTGRQEIFLSLIVGTRLISAPSQYFMTCMQKWSAVPIIQLGLCKMSAIEGQTPSSKLKRVKTSFVTRHPSLVASRQSVVALPTLNTRKKNMVVIPGL